MDFSSVVQDQIAQYDEDRSYIYEVYPQDPSQDKKSQPELDISKFSQQACQLNNSSEEPRQRRSSQLEDKLFVRIKVKRQLYNGTPSLAVFMSDASKKIKSIITEKSNQEMRAQA